MKLELNKIFWSAGNQEFSFDVTISEKITGIVGPSGAGKTTLMNILSGIITPESGSLVLDGKTLFDSKTGTNVPVNKRDIGVVFQDYYLFPHLNIKKNLTYSWKYREVDSSFDQVVDLLEIRHLLGKRPVSLSGGERQRAAIARALLMKPGLLLLDEPFSNLDQKKRRQIISHLHEISSQMDIPMIIISHDIDDILKLTRTILMVSGGRIVASGDILHIMKSQKTSELPGEQRYVNTFEGEFSGSKKAHRLFQFSFCESSAEFVCNNELLGDTMSSGQRVKFSIRPEDIALALNFLEGISIQNQLPGIIEDIKKYDSFYYITVSCGTRLTVRVTEAAVTSLGLETGKTIYCLFKANVIEVVHIY